MGVLLDVYNFLCITEFHDENEVWLSFSNISPGCLYSWTLFENTGLTYWHVPPLYYRYIPMESVTITSI